MNAARQVVRRILAGRGFQAKGAANVYAPANIALVKYWGKRDEALNLPVTGSLSISLGPLGSHVELAQGAGAADAVWLNGSPLSADSSFARRASAFLDLFRPAPDFAFALKARNTVPTAAGFASSASGFAALAKAADALFGWGLAPRELSILARLGSGSAARSLEAGFVEWHAGTAADGMEGLEKVASFSPDLILLDINMPRMSGFEVAKKLRDNPCGKTIHIFVISSLKQENNIDRGYELGIEEYITKPFNTNLLQLTFHVNF